MVCKKYRDQTQKRFIRVMSLVQLSISSDVKVRVDTFIIVQEDWLVSRELGFCILKARFRLNTFRSRSGDP